MNDEEQNVYDFAEELRGDYIEENHVSNSRSTLLVGLLVLLAVLGMCGVTGCASQTVDEIYQAAVTCGNGEECQELWDRWNRLEDRRQAKEQADAPVRACNQAGGMMYCINHIGSRDCQCIPRQSLSQIFR